MDFDVTKGASLESASQTWLSASQFADLSNINRQNAQKAIKRGTWRGCKLIIRCVEGKGKRGGKRREVLLSSLPQELQLSYKEKHSSPLGSREGTLPAEQGASSSTSSETSASIPAPSPVPSPEDVSQFERLSESEKQRLRFKQAVVVALLNRKKGEKVETLIHAEWLRHDKPGKKPSRTLAWQWCKVWEKEGALGLLDKRGKHQLKQMPTWCQEQIEATFFKAKGKLKAKHCWEALCTSYSKQTGVPLIDLLNGTASPPISVATVRRHLRKLKQTHAEALMLVSAPDQYKSHRQAAFGFADQGIEQVNQLWEIDGSPLDLMLTQNGVQRRFHLIAIIDVKSRFAVAEIVETQNSLAVQRLLHKAIEQMGLPATIAIDNGKDYLSQNVQDLLSFLHIHVNRLPPYSGEKKPFIERWIKTCQHDFCEKSPGFIGHSVSERQAIEAQVAKADRLSGRKTQSTDLLEWSHAQDLLDQWVAHYNQSLHSSLGATPLAVFGSQAIRKLPAEQLLYALGERHNRKVLKKGIMVKRHWYQSAELAAHIGKAVVICQFIDDVRHGFVFDEKGHYLCAVRDVMAQPLSAEELRQAKKTQALATKKIKQTVKLAGEGGADLREVQASLNHASRGLDSRFHGNDEGAEQTVRLQHDLRLERMAREAEFVEAERERSEAKSTLTIDERLAALDRLEAKERQQEKQPKLTRELVVERFHHQFLKGQV